MLCIGGDKDDEDERHGAILMRDSDDAYDPAPGQGPVCPSETAVISSSNMQHNVGL